MTGPIKQSCPLYNTRRTYTDNVKTLLTVSCLNMDTLLPTLTKEQQEKLLLSIEGNEKAMEHVDDLSLAINSDWLKGMGLVKALDQEIEKLRQTGLYEIETRISEFQSAMDTDRELLVFRIVQEVISNIIKHSGAKKILFSIQYEQDRVALNITDDGKGFDLTARKSGRMGMNNMQVRAQISQAQFAIETAPGKGTSINVSVPYTIKTRLRFYSLNKASTVTSFCTRLV